MPQSEIQDVLDQLPPYILKLLQEWGIISPQTDIGSPNTPEWGRQWSGFGWAGFMAPASLAPYYAWSMVQRAYRAGYIPTEWAEQPSGGYGMFTYAGRETQAESQAATYQLNQILTGQAGSNYNASQAALWLGRASYWNLQQAFTPMAEAWSATKLLSYVSPEAYIIRALGFPFYGGIQTMLAGYAQAPYVQAALALDPTARGRMQQSSMFFAGQYPSLAEELIGGVGEWTIAQMIGWGATAPKGRRLASMKSALPLSLIQPGLQMLMGPISTMATRAAWGEPIFYNEAERRTVAFDIALGTGLTTAGALLWMQQGAAVPTATSPFGGPWGAVTAGETYGPYNMTVAEMFRMRNIWADQGFRTNIRFLSLPEEVRLATYQDRLGRPFGYRQITENEYRIFVGEFGDRYPTLEEGRYGETFFGKGYGRGIWAEGFTEGEAEIAMYRPSLGLAPGLGVIGSLAGIPAFFGAEQMLSKTGPMYLGGRQLSKGEQEIVTQVGAAATGFGASWYYGKLASQMAPALEEIIYARALGWAPAIIAASGLITGLTEGYFAWMAGSWVLTGAMGPLMNVEAEELSKRPLNQLTSEFTILEKKGWSGVPYGQLSRIAYITAIASKTGGAEFVNQTLGLGMNIPSDIALRYIAERNPDIMKILDPRYANIARSTSYLYSPISEDLSKLPTGILDRYVAMRNPDVIPYLTSKDWREYYARHPELETPPFTATEIMGMPSDIQARYLAEGNPNYLSYYYGPTGPPETAYWANRAARESVWSRWVTTGQTVPNPYRYGSTEYYAWENENPLGTRATRLIEERIPWKYYSPSVTGEPTGYWAPDVSRITKYMYGSPEWATQWRSWMSAAGDWRNPDQPRHGATVEENLNYIFEHPSAWTTTPSTLPDWVQQRYLAEGIPIPTEIVWNPTTLTWEPTAGVSRYSELYRKEKGFFYPHKELGPWVGIGAEGHYTYTSDRTVSSGGGTRGWTDYAAAQAWKAAHWWRPQTLAERRAEFQSTLESRNWLYYPSTLAWQQAVGLGSDYQKSPQGRYGTWWGGYYREGKDPWEFEKGRYALWADAPSIEDMSGQLDAVMIGDEMLWFAENSDFASVVGAEFYRIGRENQ